MRVVDLVIIVARAQGHDDFLQRRVAGALADAVDGAFDLPRAVFDGRQRIGDGQAQIVMAMGRQNDVLLADDRQLRQQVREDLAVARGRGVADGVGQIDRRCPGLDGGLDDLLQELQLRPARILRRELHIVRVFAGLLDRFDAQLDDLLASLFQLVLAMNFGGGAENVDARCAACLDGFAGPLDVLGRAAGQAADDAVSDLGGDGVDRFKVAVGADGEAGFDDIDAHRLELPGDLQLFRRVSVAPGDCSPSRSVVSKIRTVSIRCSFGPKLKNQPTKKPYDLDRRASSSTVMNQASYDRARARPGRARASREGRSASCISETIKANNRGIVNFPVAIHGPSLKLPRRPKYPRIGMRISRRRLGPQLFFGIHIFQFRDFVRVATSRVDHRDDWQDERMRLRFAVGVLCTVCTHLGSIRG